MQIGRLQRRRRKAFVDVAQDRLRLVQRKAVVLESRHLGERVAFEVRWLAVFAEADLDKVVRDALFGQRQPGAPDIGAARRAIDNRPRHELPLAYILTALPGYP